MNVARMEMTATQLKRNHARFLLLAGINFFEVAKAYGISPRVLLAWEQHEGMKWENDAYVGREPGPDENYSGLWPSVDEELSAYMTMDLKPNDIPDPDLSSRYKEYRKRVLSIARKRASS